MGTITVGRIIDRVEKVLLDETNVQWTVAELLDYFNAAMNFICSKKPDTYIVDAALSLAASSRQTLPAAGQVLIDIIQNLGANGTTPGESIRQIDRNHLDNALPTWHTSTGAAVKHFTYDKREPKAFYVYPYVATTWNVRAVYGSIPPAVTVVGDTVPIDDTYEYILTYLVLSWAYSKNAKRGDVVKADWYMKQAMDCIEGKGTAQFAFSPMPPDVTTQSEGTR